MRTHSAVRPNAALYMMSCGFSRMELIMKAARKSSLIPFCEKDAQIGIVPYMHRGDAMPRRLAAIQPIGPVSRCPRRAQRR